MAQTPPSAMPLVEVCAGTLSDALLAAAAGANRIELCCATELGGLTPSIGVLESVLERVDLPVMVMVRPRPGGFCYDPDDFRAALRDAARAIQLGAHGIVFGFLTRDSRIDIDRCRACLDIAGPRQTVFHRAFDFVADAMAAVDQLAELGTTRLLTSGQRQSAIEGAPLIRQIVERTAGCLEVIPGGKIGPQNVREVLGLTGCNQVHIGAGWRADDGSLDSNAALNLVGLEYLECGTFRQVDREIIAKVVDQLRCC